MSHDLGTGMGWITFAIVIYVLLVIILYPGFGF